MTWQYDQGSGVMSRDGEALAIGYSGAGTGKNNPDMQAEHNIGPIPRGEYKIGAPCDTKTHGPFVLSLTPDAQNTMCGRSGFLIHGDSIEHPGTASQGCIILARGARESIWESGDRALSVY